MVLKLKVKNIVTKLCIATKSLNTSRMTGNYKSAFKGTGLDFEGFRPYQMNDDSKLIDWKASLRSPNLLIKEFREERNLNVYFLLDVSSSMIFGSGEKLKTQFGAEVIASIAYSSMENDDSVGFGMFNDKMIRWLRPKTGEENYYSMLGFLSNNKLYGGEYDLGKALDFVLQILDGGSVLFIVSDFIGLKGDWESKLKVVSSKFDVIALMIRDPRDRVLPETVGDVVISNPYGSGKIALNPKSINKKYVGYVKQQEYQLKEMFKRTGADFLDLSTDKDFVNPLVELFARRKLKYH
jgi:uncharacterized protein (DUF58 family)